MKYLLSHRTSYSYASSVDSAHHIAHLRARAFPGQKVSSLSIEANPAPALDGLSTTSRSSGNGGNLVGAGCPLFLAPLSAAPRP